MQPVLPPLLFGEDPSRGGEDTLGSAVRRRLYTLCSNAYTSNLSPAELWVQLELPYYSASYTTVRDLTVSVATFNVACKKPALSAAEYAALASLGSVGGNHEDNAAASAQAGERPDVMVLSFQEIDMGATALWKIETEAAAPWVQGACAAVGADTTTRAAGPRVPPYYMLPPRQLVGILLCVFIRRELLPGLAEHAVTTVATGALGGMGNKGAVGVHMVLYNTSICIIGAHLAAGQDSVAKRNDDINVILKTMDFSAKRKSDGSEGAPSAATGVSGTAVSMAGAGGPGVSGGGGGSTSAAAASGGVLAVTPLPLLPRDHDIIICAGDFNYRLSTTYERAASLARCCQSPQGRSELSSVVPTLLEYDQLRAEMRDPLTPWHGFVDVTPEGFLPTYRFDVGTCQYDTSEKRRVPSYTDRICVWTRTMSERCCCCNDTRAACGLPAHYADAPGGFIVERLGALSSICMSDHKPVVALLRVPLRVTREEEQRRCLGELRATVTAAGGSSFTSANRGSVALDAVGGAVVALSVGEVCLGELQYHRAGGGSSSKRCTVSVTNIGQATALVSVHRRTSATTSNNASGTDFSAGAWLRVWPQSVVILPGESVELAIEAKVEARLMPWLSSWAPLSGRGQLSLTSQLALCARSTLQCCGSGPLGNVVSLAAVAAGAPPPLVLPLICTATLLPSVFANSLDNISLLGHLPCIAGYETKLSPRESTAASSQLLLMRPQVPKELWVMADALSRSPQCKGMFSVPSSLVTLLAAAVDEGGGGCARVDAAQELREKELREGIMTHLDTRAECFPVGTDPRALSQCLLIFLAQLQMPVVPFAFYHAALAAGRASVSGSSNGVRAPVALLQALPVLHANVFVYVVSLLNLLLRPVHSTVNGLTASFLAEVFSAVMIMRPPPCGPDVAAGDAASAAAEVMRHGEGGAVNLALRQQMATERADATALVAYFLTTPPEILMKY